MKHLTIVVPEGSLNLSSVIGTWKIFNRANEYWQTLHGKRVFDIHLAGLSPEVQLYGGLFSVHPSPLSRIGKTDLVIIPSINKDYENSINRNPELISWIKGQHQNGAELASICTGAFLLAAGGLLNGRQCSTHWSARTDFQKMFPEVDAITQKVITYDRGIYSNGGAFSFLNLVIHLVERYFDRTTAIYCAKVFQVDLDRRDQSRFAIFAGQKHHADELIKAAQTRIETHYRDKISFQALANELAVSRRNFDRRFSQATGNTPVEYQQRIRIEAAKDMLEKGQENIGEVMYAVGYSDPKAFREVFRKVTGMTPLEYKQRYNEVFFMYA